MFLEFLKDVFLPYKPTQKELEQWQLSRSRNLETLVRINKVAGRAVVEDGDTFETIIEGISLALEKLKEEHDALSSRIK